MHKQRLAQRNPCYSATGGRGYWQQSSSAVAGNVLRRRPARLSDKPLQPPVSSSTRAGDCLLPTLTNCSAEIAQSVLDRIEEPRHTAAHVAGKASVTPWRRCSPPHQPWRILAGTEDPFPGYLPDPTWRHQP